MNLGERIKMLRLEKNLTQSELAKIAGISRVAIGNYERGTRIPNIDILLNISKALGVTINNLLEFDVKLDNGGTASYSFKNRISDIDKLEVESLSDDELLKRRIAYIEKLHGKNPNDKKISNILERINNEKELSNKDLIDIDGYNQAENLNNSLGGDLLLIPEPEITSFHLFKKLLKSLDYSDIEIKEHSTYLFKKIKYQIELEFKILNDR
ncbi:helix-turn-helix domain protein [Clostridium botulinum C str. Eklund]|nr:helix-turn-helix domain protein [Clostridium botulinum C str. Eklund]NEZ49303.1 helix-turn-helix domain-containing protein [Clostridium botulinum]